MIRNAVIAALLSSVCFAAGAEAGAAVAAPGAVIPARLKAPEKELLQELAAAGDTGTTIADDTAPAFVTLLKALWVETNESTRNGKSISVRLSATGKAKVDSFRQPRSPDAVSTRPTADLSNVDIEEYDTSKIATTQRAARAVYPFEKLTAKGLSFFVAAPEDFPADKDFAATKAGTVGGYNRKQKEAFEATDAAERPPGAVPIVLKAINDTKGGVRGVRFVRMS